jgi:hypothetical protein
MQAWRAALGLLALVLLLGGASGAPARVSFRERRPPSGNLGGKELAQKVEDAVDTAKTSLSKKTDKTEKKPCPEDTDGEVCSGHGSCEESVCVCQEPWKGTDCGTFDKITLKEIPSRLVTLPVEVKGICQAMAGTAGDCPAYALVWDRLCVRVSALFAVAWPRDGPTVCVCLQYVAAINKQKIKMECSKPEHLTLPAVCEPSSKLKYFAECPALCGGIVRAWCQSSFDAEAQKKEAAKLAPK